MPSFLFCEVERILYFFYFLIVYRNDLSQILCGDNRSRAVFGNLKAVECVEQAVACYDYAVIFDNSNRRVSLEYRGGLLWL